MEFYQELEKLASDIESTGFEEENIEYDAKIAYANAALEKLAQEIDSPSAKKDVAKIEKVASFGSRLASGLGQTAIVGLSVAIAGRTLDKLEKDYDKKQFNRKANHLIQFAKHENPSLESVSDGKMRAWLNSAYTVAPRIAKDPMLASSFLSTAHAVGGVDLNTAKTIAEVQQRGGKDYNKSYDAIRSSSGGLSGAVMNLE